MREDEDAVVTEMLDQIRVESSQKPVFLFMGLDDPHVRKDLETIATRNMVPMEVIED